MSKLNPRQLRFVDEYLVDLNATQAAIRAGYSAKTARQIGDRLLTKVDIQKLLTERMQARSERTEITQDRVLKELAKIGFSDIRKAVNWGSTIPIKDEESGEVTLVHGISMVPSGEVDDDTAAAISEIAQTQQGLKVKFHDKQAALVNIGKHLGMFIEKKEHSGPNGGPIPLVSVTADELAAAVRNVQEQF